VVATSPREIGGVGPTRATVQCDADRAAARD